ncbi:MAG TPA: tetratricopeptide repeat protein, partial [Gemmatimonadetes bacterium]|nr:tetratricopeptide repeat protein [Gemmatimonadota bacterium]
GELQEGLGEADESAAALDAAVLIYPYEIELHERLAEAHTERGDATGTVRERRAIVALAPADLAEAHYELARAYLSDGRPADARRAVLRALEIAPSFEDALDLLLEVRRGATSGPKDSTGTDEAVPEGEETLCAA